MTGAAAENNARWIQLTQWEAERHSLYGVHGWLRAILTLGVVEVLLGSFFFLTSAPSLVFIAIFVPLAALKGWVLFLGFDLRPGFRALILWLTSFHLAAIFAAIVFQVSRHEYLGTEPFFSLMAGCVGLGYFMVSRRVRVTYLWQIGADDPQLQDCRTEPGPATLSP